MLFLKYNKNGLTLIELVVVIAIILILSSIIILVASQFINDARISRDEANARNLFTSVTIQIGLDEIQSYDDITVANLKQYIDLSSFAKGTDWDVTLQYSGTNIVGVLSSTFGRVTYNKDGSSIVN